MLSSWLLSVVAVIFGMAGGFAAIEGNWWLVLYCVCASLIQLSVIGGMR